MANIDLGQKTPPDVLTYHGPVLAKKLLPLVPFIIYLAGCIPKAGESPNPIEQVINSSICLASFAAPFLLPAIINRFNQRKRK
ncbi:MAG: hypothetical protein AAB437_01005 [Patescibacteria group bacterium]